MNYISIFSMPIFIAIFIISGLVKRIGVYDCFIEGAKDGAKTMLNIFPALLALMVCIHMLRESGALELASNFLSPVLKFINMPHEVLPLALLRPISGSASLAIVTDIFNQFGPDSEIGKIASVMMGSTETTFYTIAVYLGAVNIKKSRHTLVSSLSADLTGIIMACVITHILI